MSYSVPQDWITAELGEITNISGGKRMPKGKILTKDKTPHPYIRVADYNDNRNLEIHDDFEYVPSEIFPKIRKYTVNERDLIISIVGTIGNVAMIGKTLDQANLTENCAKIFDYNKSISSNYLYYYLTSTNTKNKISNLTVGAVQKKLPLKNLRKLEIILPPISEQKVIAGTLSALDDKIELNNKINKNLEEQAQLLFKHWFVDFEFPNEEGLPYKSNGGEMVDSELGMIPKGWEIDSLGKSNLGKLKTSGIEEFEGEKIYLATADISDTRIVNESTKVTLNDKPSRANMQPTPNTVWFAKMKDSRKLILVDENDYRLQNRYILSTGFAGIQATKLSVYFLWTYIQSEAFDEIKNLYSTGTTMQAINNKNINQIKIPIPNDEILKQFSQVVEPMYKKIINSRIQNQKLSENRDTLLPKLMSGEIRIPLD